jgi:hypothetical protein
MDKELDVYSYQIYLGEVKLVGVAMDMSDGIAVGDGWGFIVL